jgi:HAMP domain-containing protein
VSADTAALLAAYRAARYRFDVNAAVLELRIDVPNAALRELLQAGGHHSATCLTAANPASHRLSAMANEQAHAALCRELQRRQKHWYPGENMDPSGVWPAEISVLALDLSAAEAQSLAQQFGQLAYVWCDAMGTPHLVLT